MRHVLRVFVPLIVLIVFVNLYFTHPDGMISVGNYPVWMKDSSGNHTSQTSGLTYVGEMDGKKVFIAADDIGKLNRLVINERMDPPQMEIYPIAYSEKVTELFNKFKKTDMEDVFYDRFDNKIRLAIEGHEYSSYDPEIYKKKEGIYEITFNKDILTFDSILTIKRMNFPQEVYSHTFDNISFEGFSATENYYFLGLENLSYDGTNFSDSTYIYIIDRRSGELKTLSTRELKISSVCGLYAANDYELYGIDRNRLSLFCIRFNDDFTVNSSETKELILDFPQHRDISGIVGAAPESITFDAKGNIYIALDPWLDYYRPDITARKRLSPEEIKNFSDGVPVMYKFKNPFF